MDVKLTPKGLLEGIPMVAGSAIFAVGTTRGCKGSFRLGGSGLDGIFRRAGQNDQPSECQEHCGEFLGEPRMGSVGASQHQATFS